MDKKEYKQKRKEYFKMIRKHKRILSKINKELAMWDWTGGLDYLVAWITYLRDYYKLGFNIDLDDQERERIVSSLDQTLDAYHEWQDFSVQYFHLEEKDVFTFEREENNGVRTSLVKFKYPELYSDESLETYERQLGEKRDAFFSLLSKNLETWWN